jgi:predicted transposase YdaD
MEEASKMFDIDAVLKTPWEEAGYVTRKMILAAAEAKAEGNAKIVKNALAQGIALETIAAITELEIEKVREIAEQNREIKGLK